jgi:hypothetical protein
MSEEASQELSHETRIYRRSGEEAVKLMLEDRLEDGLRGVPSEAIREVLTIA